MVFGNMGKQGIGISFWNSDALVGRPPNPGSDALRPIEHAWRRGFMLRMTSRGRLALQRRGDSRFSGARGAAPCSDWSYASGLDIRMSGPLPRRAQFIHGRRPCIEVRHSSLAL